VKYQEGFHVVDLVLFNANVITMDPAFPKVKCVAIKDGKILVLLQRDNFRELRHQNTKVIDCKGRTVLPGFIDAHLHFYGLVESFLTLNLEPRNNVRSISDIQDKIRDISREVPARTWIRGRGYHEFTLVEKRHPTRWDLDEATPYHPIKLTHRSGHAQVLNSLALKMVGISKETPDPPGGLIDRHIETGEPTGLLYGMGDSLAERIPPIHEDRMESGVKLADMELSSLGITSVHDTSSRNDLSRWKMLQHWMESGLFKTRINMALGLKGFQEYQKSNFSTGENGSRLNLKGVKIILHETTGDLSPGREELNERVLRIHDSGMQVLMHAVEKRTIEAACDAIDFALQRSPRPDHRHRIEHCSVCPPSLAKQIASLGIFVVTQPSFLYYNGERYLKTVPESELNYLYPIATLKKSNVRVAGSSDCPVVPANPLIGIYSAVSRRTENGEFVLPEERISPSEALKMYTIDAAKATFEEGIKGSLTPGKLADLVVLSDDPTKLPINEIKDIQVEMTILNGEVVWDKIS
jgi:predicted amidohydrolase YtcJ